MDKRFSERVTLLMQMLPAIDAERRFALKGGTAINLFEHDLPRLSVDIDLTWLPMQDFATDAEAIADALSEIANRLAAPPLRLHVTESAAQGSRLPTRLIATRGRGVVKVETTPVMRGTVHPVRRMDVTPAVERHFGSAQMQVLDFNDLYAGKLAAALSRQHPRDLFDVALLLQSGRFDDALWRTFLIYLTCSPKPAAEILDPSEPREFEAVFKTQFQGMTAEPVAAASLLEARSELLRQVGNRLDLPSRSFLESVEAEAPDFGLIGLPRAAGLPGVRRKLENLARRSQAKRESDREQLASTLTRMAARRDR